MNKGYGVPVGVAGIVTLSEPVMMGDEQEHKYIWAREWRESPQPEEPVDRPIEDDGGEYAYATLVSQPFRGLVAVVGGDVEVALPWEMVIGWVKCEAVPQRVDIYLCVKAEDDSY